MTAKPYANRAQEEMSAARAHGLKKTCRRKGGATMETLRQRVSSGCATGIGAAISGAPGRQRPRVRAAARTDPGVLGNVAICSVEESDEGGAQPTSNGSIDGQSLCGAWAFSPAQSRRPLGRCVREGGPPRLSRPSQRWRPDHPSLPRWPLGVCHVTRVLTGQSGASQGSPLVT